LNRLVLDGICTPQWPFERYVAQAQVGHLLNSCRTDPRTRSKGNANVVPVFEKVLRDKDGVLQVPFYACKDIQAGQELVWDYNFKAMGRGYLDAESPSEEEIDEDLLDDCADSEASGEGHLKVNSFLASTPCLTLLKSFLFTISNHLNPHILFNTLLALLSIWLKLLAAYC
jgi:hypothetical protein